MVRKISLIIIIILTVLIFRNYPTIRDNIIMSCELFLNRIFPSLFPMFIISSILINLNFIFYIKLIFHNLLTKLFKIDENTTFIFLMSIISGCPSNAKIAKEMYEDEMIDRNAVQKVILFSHFTNPLFVISMVKYHPYLVLFAHYFSNIIIGFSVRKKYISEKRQHPLSYQKKPFGEILTTSINNAMTTLLFILGTIVTFYIITSIINHPIASLFIEISQGLNYLNSLSLSIKAQTILSGVLLSFGGWCIHFQVYGILSNLKIKYLPYLLARIAQALLTAVIILLFIPK